MVEQVYSNSQKLSKGYTWKFILSDLYTVKTGVLIIYIYFNYITTKTPVYIYIYIYIDSFHHK